MWTLAASVAIVVSGTYTTGRGPCELLPDGSRRWALLRGFTVATVHRGRVRADYIGVQDPVAVSQAGERIRLAEGARYMLLLRPSPESAEWLENAEGGRSRGDVLRPDEVLAIVPLPE